MKYSILYIPLLLKNNPKMGFFLNALKSLTPLCYINILIENYSVFSFPKGHNILSCPIK